MPPPQIFRPSYGPALCNVCYSSHDFCQALNHECVANYPSFYPTPAQHYTMMNFDIILSGDGFLIMNSSSNLDLFYNNSRRVLNNTNLHCHQTRLHKNASLCTRPTQRYRRSFRVALHISYTQHCATVKWAIFL